MLEHVAAPKKSPPAFPAAPDSTGKRHGFEVERGSGLRERETTPAPPPSARTFNPESMQVSSRPTTVPDYDFSALAAGTSSLRHDALPAIHYAAQAQDVTIPVRTSTTPPDDLPHRLAVLLFHVDGRASIGQIAHCIDLPIADVIKSFIELTSLGLVELATPTLR
jgi:hypothetical protein